MHYLFPAIIIKAKQMNLIMLWFLYRFCTWSICLKLLSSLVLKYKQNKESLIPLSHANLAKCLLLFYSMD